MDKRVSIRRLDDNLHFEAVNPSGKRIEIDGSDEEKAMLPIELLLAAIGSCSAFDVAMMLERQGQKIDDLHIEVDGQRREEGECKPYHAMHMIFTIHGEIDPNRAERAVALAVEKYCSVGATFRPETKVTYELQMQS
ncbi:OsmC family protein [Cryomorphaceae bacterium 1068]|nr:OsmC family protein [Cryomorphaceae bacterium 1068]